MHTASSLAGIGGLLMAGCAMYQTNSLENDVKVRECHDDLGSYPSSLRTPIDQVTLALGGWYVDDHTANRRYVRDKVQDLLAQVELMLSKLDKNACSFEPSTKLENSLRSLLRSINLKHQNGLAIDDYEKTVEAVLNVGGRLTECCRSD